MTASRSSARLHVWRNVLLGLLLGTATAGIPASESPQAPAGEAYFLGRKIADTMHHSGAPWLTRDTREQEERCSLLLAQLGLQPGMTVCDLGCGNGYYSLHLARRVGPAGRVLAVDVQPEMLKLLATRAEQEALPNLVPVLGGDQDPRLPEAELDLILLVDVYHEFSQPRVMLAAMRQALTARGVVALVEYREEDPQVPIKPLHKMSKRQILKEWLPHGFRLVREVDGLPWQHLMFFARDDAPEPRRPGSPREGGS